MPTSQLFPLKALWSLIWPLLIEQLLQITVGIADIIMVSQLGEEAVSGVSLVDQINILLTQIFAALATGGAVVSSQYIGNRNIPKASVSARQLIYVVTSLALLLLLFCLITRRPLLANIFGAVTPEVMSIAQLYFLITIFALPSIALYSAAAALFRSQGNSAISMKTALLTNCINVAGNAIMIFGLHSGVEGVAIPTVLSRTIGAAILMHKLHAIPQSDTNVNIRGLRSFSLDWNIIRKILAVGIPSGIENSMFQIGKLLVLSLIATYGTAAVAANAATNTLASLEVLPGASVGLAMLTVVGQCVGAGQPDQAERYVKKLMLIAYAGILIVNIPFLLNLQSVLNLYGLSDETSHLAYIMTMTHGIFGILIWPLSFTLPNALRASGLASFTMLVSIISVWLVRVGLSYLFAATDSFGFIDYMNWPQSYGAESTWIAMVTDWLIRSILFVWKFKQGKWKTYKIQ